MNNLSKIGINKRLMSCATLDEFMSLLSSEVPDSSVDEVLVLTDEECEAMEEFLRVG